MPCPPIPRQNPPSITHHQSTIPPVPCPPADECILAGTSAGFLQLHSAASGALLLRQQLHHAAAASAAVRWSGAGSDPEDLSEDVTLCFADAVVRLPAWEVWAAVRWAAGRGGSGWWRGGDGAAPAAQHHQLSFSKFQLPKGAGGWHLLGVAFTALPAWQ